MIFGVSANGVFLTNPLESVSERVLLEQLCSDSELLIRRSDIISRWHPSCDLRILNDFDEKWDNLNVLGQVVEVLRQEPLAAANQSSPASSNSASASQHQQNPVQRTHVRIPAMYKSGITLFVDRVNNAECYQKLISSPELTLR